MKVEYKKANDRFIKTMNDCIANKEYKLKNRRDFAGRIHITPATITHISNYTQNVPYTALFELKKEFGISANYILFNEGVQRVGEPQKNTLEDLIKRVSELERKVK